MHSPEKLQISPGATSAEGRHPVTRKVSEANVKASSPSGGLIRSAEKPGSVEKGLALVTVGATSGRMIKKRLARTPLTGERFFWIRESVI